MKEVSEEIDAQQDISLTPKAIYEFIRKGRKQCGLEEREVEKAIAES